MTDHWSALLDQVTHRTVMRYHPLLGFSYVPNLVARLPHERGGYLIRTNSLGFRSNVEFQRSLRDRPRILVFGDSFTDGQGCNNDERYPELLGEALGAEVYNFGTSGSAPDQQLLMYEEFGRPIEANLIVLGVALHNIERIQMEHRPSSNRVTGETIMMPKPYFTLEGGKLKLHHVPVPRVRPELRVGEERGYLDEQGDPSNLERLYFAPWLGRFRDILRSHFPDAKDRLRSWAYRAARVHIYDDYLDAAGPGWRLMAALIRRFKEQAGRIPLLVVPLPTFHYYVDKLKPVYEPLFDSLADSESGLFVYGLTRDLVAGKTLAERRRISFEHDTHYSPYGHAEIARLIAGEIRRLDILPAARAASRGISSHVRAQTRQQRYILGVSFGGRDSAAVLVKDGNVIAAAREADFAHSNDPHGFPALAANYCLEEASISQNELAAVAYGRLVHTKIERDAYSLIGNQNKKDWVRTTSSWILNELDVYRLIRNRLRFDGLLLETAHGAAHCASAFYPSPFESAAIVSFHGAGEWETASIAMGTNEDVRILTATSSPHSLDHFYSELARFIGFSDGAADQAQMWALAHHGEPEFLSDIRDNLLDLKDDGSCELNLGYFPMGQVADGDGLSRLFGGPGRMPRSAITKREADIARSVQAIVCDAVIRTARHAQALTGETKLCVSGKPVQDPAIYRSLLEDRSFEEVWIQPAVGDASAALGAALQACHGYFGRGRGTKTGDRSASPGQFWGPGFSDEEIEGLLDTHGYPHVTLAPEERASTLATMLEEGQSISYFSGRQEFGSHFSSGRCIVGDPRNESTLANLDLRVKHSDLPSPLPVALLEDKTSDYAALIERSSCLPVLVSKPDRPRPGHDHIQGDRAIWARAARSAERTGMHELLRAFADNTGCGIVVNAPLTLRGEAAACTPFDAYQSFMLGGTDALLLENHLLLKKDQPPWPNLLKRSEVEAKVADQAHDGPLTRALEKLYEKRFIPAWRSLRSESAIGNSEPFKQTRSLWRECANSTANSSISEVHPALDRDRANPRQTAEALLSYWRPGQVSDHFEPILMEIVKLSARRGCPPHTHRYIFKP
ncbi:MAG: hypothetical protein IID05_10425 [Gemmatimonadetes bacterium]|nr:hypothetical protein [Gemmatimonadota bacterium]